MLQERNIGIGIVNPFADLMLNALGFACLPESRHQNSV
jgi:hypothetical protein